MFSFFVFFSCSHLPPSTYRPNYLALADSPLSTTASERRHYKSVNGTVNDSGRLRETREGKGEENKMYSVYIMQRYSVTFQEIYCMLFSLSWRDLDESLVVG